MWIDTDVLNAFREAAERECKGYQTTINEALRAVAFRGGVRWYASSVQSVLRSKATQVEVQVARVPRIASDFHEVPRGRWNA